MKLVTTENMTSKLLTGYVITPGQVTTSDSVLSAFQNLAGNGALLASTGLLTGGSLSINADPTKYDVSAGTGIIVDNHTNPSTPTYTTVSWNAFTAQSPLNIDSVAITTIGISSSGTLVELNLTDINNLVRDYIFIGILQHPNLTTITSVSNIGLNIPLSPCNSLVDMSLAIGPINESGNVYSANGANLLINKSGGTVMQIGINFKNSKKNPNRIYVDSTTGAGFIYTYQDGGGLFTNTPSSAIVPGSYDDGSGTLATVSPNRWSVQRIYMLAALTIIHYGQHTYGTVAAAVDGITTDSFTLNPDLSGSLLRGYIVVRGSGTALNSTSDAVFIEAGKFGGAAANAGTSSTTNLQQSYDNSVTPEIVTDSTRGALTVKRGSAADTDYILDGQNAAGTVTFGVRGNGNIDGTSLTITSTTQGIVFPTMTTTQKNAIATPVAGTVVYDTTLNKLCVYTTTWETITSV